MLVSIVLWFSRLSLSNLARLQFQLLMHLYLVPYLHPPFPQVVKKVMKMDAAEPFNVPVNPEALGIPVSANMFQQAFQLICLLLVVVKLCLGPLMNFFQTLWNCSNMLLNRPKCSDLQLLVEVLSSQLGLCIFIFHNLQFLCVLFYRDLLASFLFHKLVLANPQVKNLLRS